MVILVCGSVFLYTCFSVISVYTYFLLGMCQLYAVVVDDAVLVFSLLLYLLLVLLVFLLM